MVCRERKGKAFGKKRGKRKARRRDDTSTEERDGRGMNDEEEKQERHERRGCTREGITGQNGYAGISKIDSSGEQYD